MFLCSNLIDSVQHNQVLMFQLGFCKSFQTGHQGLKDGGCWDPNIIFGADKKAIWLFLLLLFWEF